MANCKACGAEIAWIKTTKGRSMPVDARPKITVVTDGGETVTGRTPHWATCPAAERFKGAQ